MAPPPPGFRRESPRIVLPESTAPETPAAPTPARFAPVRLSIEASYMLAGEAGSPFRMGFMARFRPLSFLSAGLSLDGNFSDEFSTTARVDGIIPLSDLFQIELSALTGLRFLFGQSQLNSYTATHRPTDGFLFNLGGEIVAHLQALPELGFSLFARFLYSPPGALSSRDPNPSTSNPPIGTELESYEISAGLRVDFDIGGTHATHDEADSVEEEASPQERADAALRDLETLVAELAEEEPELETPAEPTPSESTAAPEVTASPEATPTRRETLSALQSELATLRGSSEALEREITEATHTFGDLTDATQVLQDFYIRMDRLYFAMTDSPPRLDREELQSFIRDFNARLRDSESLQRLLRSDSETIGQSFTNNISRFARDLASFSGHGDWSAEQGDLAGIASRLELLRSRTVSTLPSQEQIGLWRDTLNRIRERIETLSASLDADVIAELRSHHTRLQENFDALLRQLTDAESAWRASRTMPDNYARFTAALNPTRGHPHGDPAAARAALEAMLQELNNAPESIRTLRRRNLINMRDALVEFIAQQSRSLHPDMSEVREAAIRVVQWIDPDYTAPRPVAAVTRTRRAPRDRDRSASSTTETPTPEPPRPSRSRRSTGAESEDPDSLLGELSSTDDDE